MEASSSASDSATVPLSSGAVSESLSAAQHGPGHAAHDDRPGRGASPSRSPMEDIESYIRSKLRAVEGEISEQIDRRVESAIAGVVDRITACMSAQNAKIEVALGNDMQTSRHMELELAQQKRELRAVQLSLAEAMELLQAKIVEASAAWDPLPLKTDLADTKAELKQELDTLASKVEQLSGKVGMAVEPCLADLNDRLRAVEQGAEGQGAAVPRRCGQDCAPPWEKRERCKSPDLASLVQAARAAWQARCEDRERSNSRPSTARRSTPKDDANSRPVAPRITAAWRSQQAASTERQATGRTAEEPAGNASFFDHLQEILTTPATRSPSLSPDPPPASAPVRQKAMPRSVAAAPCAPTSSVRSLVQRLEKSPGRPGSVAAPRYTELSPERRLNSTAVKSATMMWEPMRTPAHTQ